MKKVLVLSALLLSLTLSAQWQTGYFVDEFGDSTNESYKSLIAQGTFSNSATTNSKATYKFVHNENEKTVILKVFEYGRSLARSIDSEFVSVKIKTPSGNVKVIKSVMFAKTGVLFFYKKTYEKLLSSISVTGNYIMVFEKDSGYSPNSYKLKFSID
jgi:hypothetical protein